MNYAITAEIDNKNPWTVTCPTSTAVSKQPSVWAPRLFDVWILLNELSRAQLRNYRNSVIILKVDVILAI